MLEIETNIHNTCLLLTTKRNAHVWSYRVTPTGENCFRLFDDVRKVTNKNLLGHTTEVVKRRIFLS